MAKNSVPEWDATAGNNTDVGGISIAEGMARASVNNAMREIMSQVKKAVAAQGSNIASAGTTDIGAATGQYVKVTGTTTITALGTVAAGTMRWVEFTGALTLTYNATSLILPTSANINTAAGDVGLFISLGGGNWKCPWFAPISGSPLALNITSTAAGTIGTLTSTDAGAAVGPVLDLFRNSASPAANDVLGAFAFTGKDSGGGTDTYGRIIAAIVDQTATSEDGQFVLQTAQAGTLTNCAIFESGLRMGGSPTGGDKGLGTINAKGLYVEGHGTIAQQVTTTSTTNKTLGTILPYDDSIPQSGEGDQVFSQSFTPINASSTIYVDVFLNVGGPSTNSMSCALFVDAGANAVAAASVLMPNSTSMMPLTLRYSVSAGSTTARTYSLRAGNSTATDGFLNGHASSRIFGGVAISSMTITEVLPQ